MAETSNYPGYNILENLEWTVAGIKIGYSDMSIDGVRTIKGGNDQDVIRLHFGIKGDYQFRHHEAKADYDLIGGHHNLMYSNPFNISVTNKTQRLSTFGVQFPTQSFQSFIPEDDVSFKAFLAKVKNQEPVLFSRKWGSIDSKIQIALNQIIYNTYQGTMLNIFLYAKSLELLVLCIDNYQKSNHPFQYLKRKEDQEKIIAAKEFIDQSIEDPPNLSEIAKYVGLNEYKLKRGFKEMFHQTFFSYLTDCRLGLAYRYLQDTDKTASEIAFDLGYSSSQHFSTQFKKKYGKTPGEIKS